MRSEDIFGILNPKICILIPIVRTVWLLLMTTKDCSFYSRGSGNKETVFHHPHFIVLQGGTDEEISNIPIVGEVRMSLTTMRR